MDGLLLLRRSRAGFGFAGFGHCDGDGLGLGLASVDFRADVRSDGGAGLAGLEGHEQGSLKLAGEPCADRPTDEATGEEGDEDFEFVHERFSF